MSDLADRILEYLPPASPRRLRHAVAADVESEGLRGPFSVAASMPDNGPISIHYSPEALLAYFLTHRFRNFELLFHNAEYDMWYLLPSLIELVKLGGHSVKLWVTKDLRIVHCTINHGGTLWHIRDTYSVLPMALAELAPLARLPKLDIGFRQGTIFDIGTLEHREYLERDVMITLYAYRAYQMMIMRYFQALPGYTAGATAMRCLRRTFAPGEQYIRTSPEVETIARKAYYGGYMYLPRAGEYRSVTKLDVNAMYAAAMRYPVPYGTAAYTRIEVPGAMGIYRCWVECPGRDVIPLVPVRGTGAPWYPTWGEHETYLTSNTIEYAREVGYKVSIVEGYTFNRGIFPFKHFLDRCEKLEHMYTGQGLKLVIKTLRNSLYGKFAQYGAMRTYHITLDPSDDMTPATMFGGAEVEHLYFTESEYEAGHIHPEWAAFITAQARILLHRGLAAIGQKYLYYSDTDSIFGDTEACDRAIMEGKIKVGGRYGQWKREADYTYFAPFNPKTYIGIKGDGSYDARHKGLPVWDSELNDLLQLAEGTIPEIVRYFDSYRKALASVGADSREQRRYTIRPEESDEWTID